MIRFPDERFAAPWASFRPPEAKTNSTFCSSKQDYFSVVFRHPTKAKTLGGFGGATVIEATESYDGNAYRAVYTVRYADAIYVLHAFQKKSKKGIATPKPEMDLIEKRLKDLIKKKEERQ